jgi:hypothetical protein
MSVSKRAMKAAVLRRMSSRTLHRIQKFVRTSNPQLWGTKRSRNYVGDCTLVALFKDLFAVGYSNLFMKIKKWMPTSHNSLQHNTKLIRGLLAEWGKKRILLGTLQDWEEAAQYQQFPKDINNIHLWLDTTDLRLVGKASCSHQSSKWSYKCNSPGRCYAFLCDAEGQIKKIWGGYSPKIYDGDWLEMNARWLEKKLAGANVIADTHFEWGTKNLTKVNFVTPIPKPRGRRKRDLGGRPIPKTLTKKEATFTQHVHSVRSRVENVFGRLGQKIDALTVPFREGKKQLDYLVWFGAGLLNEP